MFSEGSSGLVSTPRCLTVSFILGGWEGALFAGSGVSLAAMPSWKLRESCVTEKTRRACRKTADGTSRILK